MQHAYTHAIFTRVVSCDEVLNASCRPGNNQQNLKIETADGDNVHVGLLMHQCQLPFGHRSRIGMNVCLLVSSDLSDGAVSHPCP